MFGAEEATALCSAFVSPGVAEATARKFVHGQQSGLSRQGPGAVVVVVCTQSTNPRTGQHSLAAGTSRQSGTETPDNMPGVVRLSASCGLASDSFVSCRQASQPSALESPFELSGHLGQRLTSCLTFVCDVRGVPADVWKTEIGKTVLTRLVFFSVSQKMELRGCISLSDHTHMLTADVGLTSSTVL